MSSDTDKGLDEQEKHESPEAHATELESRCFLGAECLDGSALDGVADRL